nr:segregation and condensation protein B-like [Nerophis lumbriciformis]
MDLPTIIESLLIASEDPLSEKELARLIRARVAELSDESIVEKPDYQAPADNQVTEAISTLNATYENTARSFTITQRAKGWKIFTQADFGGFVKMLFPGQKPERLSAPAMETLAIIAYRQPVTKSSLEAVRGVSCDGMLQKLLDRELVKIGGRAILPGRPLLYETTELFLEHFGITTVEELPNIGELRQVELPDGSEEEEKPSDEENENAGQSNQDTSTAEEQLVLSAVEQPKEAPPAEPSPDEEDFATPQAEE